MPKPQGMRRRAACTVIVGGQDVTNIIFPYLISIRITITAKGEVNRAEIELDDRNAELAIPQQGTTVSVSLGWAASGPNIRPAQELPPQGNSAPLAYESSGTFIVFNGWLREAESGFSRTGGGRRMWITAIAPDLQGEAKSRNFKMWGEGSPNDQDGEGSQSFEKVLTEAFKGTGTNVAVHPGLANIKRDFWHMNESPLMLARRMAKEVGGKIRSDPSNGSNLIIEPQDSYPEGVIEAVWGYNLIAWRIKPFIPSPQWSKSKNDFFKLVPGSWSDIVQSLGNKTPFGGEGTGGFGVPNAVPNQNVGDQNNGGVDSDSQANNAGGWVILNGEPEARVSGQVVISGARPGIDATWGIVEVEHQYSRRGFTTRCDVNQPNGLAPAYEGFGWKLNNPEGGQKSTTPHIVDPADISPISAPSSEDGERSTTA